MRRRDALRTGATRYFTGKPCKHGHIAERHATHGGCVVCMSAFSKKYSMRPEWMARHAERSRAYRAKYPDKATAAKLNSQRKRPDYYRALYRFHCVKRRCEILRRTPAWADLQAIAEIYRACPAGMHVDHIVPLRGSAVSGLHVPENLQIIPARENLRKSNLLWPR